MRASGGIEHGDAGRLSPGLRRKLSLELTDKRATLAETAELIALCVGMCATSFRNEVDARGDGKCTFQQSITLKADAMRASDKMQHQSSLTDKLEHRGRQ